MPKTKYFEIEEIIGKSPSWLVKSGSMIIFINDNKWMNGMFNWQEGYGAFSYSKSQIDAVINYILTQENHHKKKTFKEEYVNFLEKFEIEFDEKYLFD